MQSLLQQRVPAMEKVLGITGQPGMSVGVLHQGREVFKHNFGVIDTQTRQKPDSDTLYCIASLSKAFIAASIDLLVLEGKISWNDTVASIIPEFKQLERVDNSVYSNMTLTDICSHRTGLLSLDEVSQGLDGRILIPKEDVLRVCSALPAKHDFRAGFLYNNALYALAACVIERVSTHSNWGNFLHDRVFAPLGMDRTTAFREVHDTDKNIATPYMILTDGTPSKIAPTELSADSMNGGSGGLRSSVNDLLEWCSCLLASFGEGAECGNLVRPLSPIFHRAAIANHASAEAGDYCTGWCHHRTPAKLGLISPNRSLQSPLLGSESSSILVYGHQGDVPGYTCSLYLVPESGSAIVILTNGTGHSDASDWIAQDLIQAMHGLQPAVDFADEARRAARQYLSHYTKDFKIPLEENQIQGTPLPRLSDFAGQYVMENLDTVSLAVSIAPHDANKLLLTVNGQRDQVWEMWHYHHDVWCHLPNSYNKCLSRGVDRTLWSSFLISFARDTAGCVHRLGWKLDGVDVFFNKH